jgi:osmotically-inducible protein OsmY
MRKLISAFVIAVAVTSGVAGCAVTKGQESTGQYVDDATITTRVKARFAKDPTVSAMRIKVETMKGAVQLSGNAKSEAERDQAVQLARSVPGVTDVKNNIQIESASSDTNSTNR